MADKPSWAKKFEDEARYDNLRPLLLRKRVRYNLSRLRTEAVDGAPKAKPPRGFKKFFEEQVWFDGWENWGVTWDVGTPMRTEDNFGNTISDDPLEVVPRYVSLNEEHEDNMSAQTRADNISTRKRKRAIKMDEANGSEDNL
jgi:hypothetical protein